LKKTRLYNIHKQFQKLERLASSGIVVNSARNKK
jgi:hypothetical protein